MDILNSQWFLSMLMKSGKTPQQRLLGMYDVLDDWLRAPLIREQLNTYTPFYPKPSEALLDYLMHEARACGSKTPEALAQQLYFIAMAALNEASSNPACGSIAHAKVAAEALLQAQKKKNLSTSKPFAYGLAASLATFFAIGGIAYSSLATAPEVPVITAAKPAPITNASLMASPAQTAELLASLEQMRKGTCHFPEALQLPDSEKAVYLENLVGGQITVNAKEQELVRRLMEKVRCNYTPMLMANSVG